MPASSLARSSTESCLASAPPWYFSARTLATITTAEGHRPVLRHLMSRNFSAPRSAPKPASVTTQSPSLSAVRVAMAELQPWAMLAKGPPWMKAGLFSRVCTRLGCSASRSSAVIAPWACRSAAVTGLPSSEVATTMRAMRAFRSARLVARHRMAMISEATTMSKPSSRG